MTNRETLEAREGQVDEQQQWLDEINVALGPDSIQIVSNDDRLQRIRQLKERLEAAEAEVERLRNLCDIAGREEQFAIDNEEELQARIEAALELHYEVEGWCGRCANEEWPCGTVKVLKVEGETDD